VNSLFFIGRRLPKSRFLDDDEHGEQLLLLLLLLLLIVGIRSLGMRVLGRTILDFMVRSGITIGFDLFLKGPTEHEDEDEGGHGEKPIVMMFSLLSSVAFAI